MFGGGQKQGGGVYAWLGVWSVTWQSEVAMQQFCAHFVNSGWTFLLTDGLEAPYELGTLPFTRNFAQYGLFKEKQNKKIIEVSLLTGSLVLQRILPLMGSCSPLMSCMCSLCCSHRLTVPVQSNTNTFCWLSLSLFRLGCAFLVVCCMTCVSFPV